MPNTKTAKARDITNRRNTMRNQSVRSKMKTIVKDAMTAIESKDAAKIKATLPAALSEIDRAATKGVIHANAAARKKSTLQRLAGKA